MKVQKQDNKKTASKIMDKSKVFIKSNGLYNLVQLRTHLQEQGILDCSSILQMTDRFTNIIKDEPNVMNITSPVTIIGDIHGQYYDFLKILTKIKNVQDTLSSNILFLGDYVDRGVNSVEVITFIMAFKINNPKRVFLLRGNHESRCMTNTYNFMKEVLSKYNQSIYQRFMQAFDALPLACLVNNSYFCVHGGISDKIINIGKINQLKRFKQIPLQGEFCDFIWSDPVQLESGQMNAQTMFNSSRQCSIIFGKELTNKFLEANSVKCIIRAHEVFSEGYKHYYWGNQNNKQPSVVTLFSAPNYCGIFGNKGAIINIQNTNFQIKQYKEQLINSKLYNYLQVFKWSIPEVARVFNQFTKAMMTSIFQVFLKDDFSEVRNAPPEIKLQLLMKYIKLQTHILDQQKALPSQPLSIVSNNSQINEVNTQRSLILQMRQRDTPNGD